MAHPYNLTRAYYRAQTQLINKAVVAQHIKTDGWRPMPYHTKVKKLTKLYFPKNFSVFFKFPKIIFLDPLIGSNAKTLIFGFINANSIP